MPALSPTMETGVLAEWYLQEGSHFQGEYISNIQLENALKMREALVSKKNNEIRDLKRAKKIEIH